MGWDEAYREKFRRLREWSNQPLPGALLVTTALVIILIVYWWLADQYRHLETISQSAFLLFYGITVFTIIIAGATFLSRYCQIVSVRTVKAKTAALEKYVDEYRFQESALMNANVLIFIIDLKGAVKIWNRAAEEISGYPASEVVGSNTIWKRLYPDPKYRRQITEEITQIIGDNNFLANLETTIRCRTGESKTISWNTRMISSASREMSGYIAIGIDVTDKKRAETSLKESEARLNSIIDGSPVLQFVIDRDHRVISWNRALEKSSGIKASEVLGTSNQWRAFYERKRPSLADLLVDEKIDELPEWYDKKFKKSLLVEGAYEATDFFPRMGTSGKWLSFTAAPVRNGDGTIIGAVETLEDITERKLAEDALTQAVRKLNLLSSITRHDVLNQISAIRGYIELLKEYATDPKALGYIDKEEKSVITIQHQIEFTRDYQELGIRSPRWQDLRTVLLETVNTINFGTVAFTENLEPVEVFADPLLGRGFYNLIDNALRHGEKITRISFSLQKEEGGLVLICEDDGVGIPGTEKLNIFNRRYFKHTGFGLFLTREILSITGLTIMETGVDGKGARFEIQIPQGVFRYKDA